MFQRISPPSLTLGEGGHSHMEQTGMLVGNFEFNPKGDHLGVTQAFCDP